MIININISKTLRIFILSIIYEMKVFIFITFGSITKDIKINWIQENG